MAADPIRAFRNAIDLLRAGDPAAAQALPELERFPQYGPGWLELGALLQDRGQYEAAIIALGRAARSSPIAAHRLGQCLAANGKRDAAIANFQAALHLDANFAQAHYSLGLAYQDTGDHTAAIHAYREALRLQTDFHEAAFNLGVSLQETGDFDTALAAYGQAFRLRPQSLARIAQALTSARHGALWLDPAALRRTLSGAHENSSGSDPVR
ncbi:tetratricopeptide repeat protein [Lichenicoccus sp.]|uniref:tetratricopeptide repeat protein n=1 Tax=Lichenicoccus sp. TaxID=2781899 RepID=UPI003D148E14